MPSTLFTVLVYTKFRYSKSNKYSNIQTGQVEEFLWKRLKNQVDTTVSVNLDSFGGEP